MKKLILILIVSIGISFYLSAQSAGDYRSVGNGNWNDPTKWETYNGNAWVGTATYPGQNAGTGAITIMGDIEIKLTASVPHPVGSLLIDYYYYEDEYGNATYTNGSLSFRSESAISLTISGDITITGPLSIENQNGAKTHTLFVGGSFFAYSGLFHAFQEDDKLAVIFNTIDSNSQIWGYGQLSFYDITFNGAGILVWATISITGKATFINGIVRVGVAHMIIFNDDAVATGASNVSFMAGRVRKIGDDPFTFPTGSENISSGNDIVYAPLTISAPVGLTESFDVQYKRKSGAALGAISDAGLYSISNCEYWIFSSPTGNFINYPLNVTIGWNAASGCGSPANYIPNVSAVTLAQFNGSWFRHGGTGTGTTTNGSVTWTGVTQTGPLALGNVGTNCGTPSGLTASGITSNSAILSWTAVTDAFSYDVEYKSALSYQWLRAGTDITSRSLVLSGLSPSVVYEWRVFADCYSGTSAGRQASFTTTTTLEACNDVYESNNTSRLAKAISAGVYVAAIISSANDVDWFKVTTPDNSNTNLEVTLSNLPADYDLYIYNNNLKLVGSSTNSGTSNEVVIYNSSRKATYYVKVIGKNGAYNASQCYYLGTTVSIFPIWSVSNASSPQKEINEGLSKQMLYPNPASEFMMLHFNSIEEGSVNVQIFNTAGQLVKQSAIKITKGYNQVKISVNDIKQGMYILRINKGELNMIRKFVIAR